MLGHQRGGSREGIEERVKEGRDPGETQETPRKHSGDTQEIPRRHQETPRRLRGDTQETPRRHPGAPHEASRAPRAPERPWPQKVLHLSAKMQKFRLKC